MLHHVSYHQACCSPTTITETGTPPDDLVQGGYASSLGAHGTHTSSEASSSRTSTRSLAGAAHHPFGIPLRTAVLRTAKASGASAAPRGAPAALLAQDEPPPAPSFKPEGRADGMQQHGARADCGVASVNKADSSNGAAALQSAGPAPPKATAPAARLHAALTPQSHKPALHSPDAADDNSKRAVVKQEAHTPAAAEARAPRLPAEFVDLSRDSLSPHQAAPQANKTPGLAAQGDNAAAHATPMLQAAPNWQAELPTDAARTGKYRGKSVHEAILERQAAVRDAVVAVLEGEQDGTDRRLHPVKDSTGADRLAGSGAHGNQYVVKVKLDGEDEHKLGVLKVSCQSVTSFCCKLRML